MRVSLVSASSTEPSTVQLSTLDGFIVSFSRDDAEQLAATLSHQTAAHGGITQGSVDAEGE